LCISYVRHRKNDNRALQNRKILTLFAGNAECKEKIVAPKLLDVLALLKAKYINTL